MVKTCTVTVPITFTTLTRPLNLGLLLKYLSISGTYVCTYSAAVIVKFTEVIAVYMSTTYVPTRTVFELYETYTKKSTLDLKSVSRAFWYARCQYRDCRI